MPLVAVHSVTRNYLVKQLAPQLAGWGVAAGSILLFAAEGIPRLRKDVYSNIPLLGQYYVWQSYKNWGQ